MYTTQVANTQKPAPQFDQWKYTAHGQKTTHQICTLVPPSASRVCTFTLCVSTCFSIGCEMGRSMSNLFWMDWINCSDGASSLFCVDFLVSLQLFATLILRSEMCPNKRPMRAVADLHVHASASATNSMNFMNLCTHEHTHTNTHREYFWSYIKTHVHTRISVGNILYIDNHIKQKHHTQFSVCAKQYN